MSHRDQINRINRRDCRNFYDLLVLILIMCVYVSSSKSETLQGFGTFGSVALFIGLSLWLNIDTFANAIRIALIKKGTK